MEHIEITEKPRKSNFVVVGLVFAALAINFFETFVMSFAVAVAGLIVLPVGYYGLRSLELDQYLRLALVALPLVYWFAVCIGTPIVIAAINIHLVTRMAAERQLFARCLAFTSVIWLVPTLLMVLLLNAINEGENVWMAAIFPGSWLLGTIAQLLWSYDRFLLPFMRKEQRTQALAQVVAEPPRLDSMIEQIGLATTSGELESLSNQCLVMLKIPTPPVDFSKPQPASALLVEELNKGNRMEDANIISQRLLDLADV